MSAITPPTGAGVPDSNKGAAPAHWSRLLLAGSACYAAGAVAPFTQGVALLEATNVPLTDPTVGQAVAVAQSSSWSGPFDFIASPGIGLGNGGVMSYLQALSVLAMTVVAAGAFLRLRRSGSQRSVTSLVAAAGVVLLLVSIWANGPGDAPKATSVGIEAFRFTPSLVVASVGATGALIGAAAATFKSRAGIRP